MMFAAGAIAVAAACSQFSSTPDAPDAGDASAESTSPPAPPPPGTSTRFYCPMPAGSCTFEDEVCCFGSSDGGYCREAGASCDGYAAALCDSPRACKALYDASTAACCSTSGVSSCARDGCGVGAAEICRPTKMPAECADASATCALASDGYGVCN